MLKKDKTLILAQPKLGFLYSLKAPLARRLFEVFGGSITVEFEVVREDYSKKMRFFKKTLQNGVDENAIIAYN